MAYSKAIWFTILLYKLSLHFQTQPRGPAALLPHTCTKGSSMYILRAYDYWCRCRHVIMSSCHHAVKKKSVLGGQRNSIYNINIIYTISLDPLSPIFTKSLSAWWHDDIMTWWHDGETRKTDQNVQSISSQGAGSRMVFVLKLIAIQDLLKGGKLSIIKNKMQKKFAPLR